MKETAFLDEIGIKNIKSVYRNLPVAQLVEEALRRGEGVLASNGSLLVNTGARTGRSPNDRFFVNHPNTESGNNIWWSNANLSADPETFNLLYARACAYLQQRDLFVFDGFSGADKTFRLPLRLVTPLAWNALFARTLFVRPTEKELAAHEPEFTVLAVGNMTVADEIEGVNSEVFVGLDLETKRILIIGSMYAGEIKKAIFTVMNYLLPMRHQLMTMHCSANIGQDDSVALFFGLSGTGKTTLSADPTRRLIGDDEHGWSDNGVFNFEGGCYAKCINLSEEAEPQIYHAIHFGSVLENVDFDPHTREPDYDSSRFTENSRASYPVDHIPNCVLKGTGGHPSDIFFLAADAFGVLPPISRLDGPHAMYHFLSGYTAKLAGTEAGIDEPKATFSACFGEPFMPLHPARYAELLGERIEKHGVRVWLVNTGWSGGPYGVGKRMRIQHTRALLNAALSGALDKVDYREDELFGLQVPRQCPGVPDQVLTPRETWPDKDAYDRKARELAGLFVENFKKYESGASEAIRNAAPKL